MKQIPGGVTAPKGFRAWGVHCGVKSKKADKKDLALILSDQECAAAAVYTMNRVKAAPLYVTMEHLEDGTAWGVAANSDVRIEIIEGLRGHTSGFCVPTFVVDAPGGGGKTPVMPQYIISQTPKKVILRNYEGVITTYTEPEHYTDCQCDYCTGKKKKELMGVAGLERGQALSMEPANLERHKREEH